MQGIYNYIPETHHVSTVYSVTAILWLTIYGPCNAVSQNKRFKVLHQYFPKYVCSTHERNEILRRNIESSRRSTECNIN
jgi:hypothetical protein